MITVADFDHLRLMVSDLFGSSNEALTELGKLNSKLDNLTNIVLEHLTSPDTEGEKDKQLEASRERRQRMTQEQSRLIKGFLAQGFTHSATAEIVGVGKSTVSRVNVDRLGQFTETATRQEVLSYYQNYVINQEVSTNDNGTTSTEPASIGELQG